MKDGHPIYIGWPADVGTFCLDDEAGTRMWFFDLVNHGNLVNCDIGYFVVFVAEIEDATRYVYHIASERRVDAAGDVDLFSHQLFE